MVTLEDLTISKTDFPTAPDGGATYAAALRQTLSSQPLTIALDRLQAALELERVEKPGQIVEVKNDPPRIIVSQGPALLVRIDGQPVLRQVAGTGLLRVINTRVLLLFDQSAGRYYCWLMKWWHGRWRGFSWVRRGFSRRRGLSRRRPPLIASPATP